ncbi:TOBE domain-containing protein [Methylobacterium haplocladii]|uniref:Mop domain-containing protein n=1 Tax=Methylobacterium haplocladii TaxID=1176176 RepID=A0A512IK68_9HYPH|nr:TOBE domain-containing protein [Methylobacterium haplocladii]GEO98081.1 hypothetical protein MHA02_04690 [Methylobacterium haplocladii]GLS59068.1 hypothetical protein GCM10007887_17340 [Methylobacterium haplocladii]
MVADVDLPRGGPGVEASAFGGPGNIVGVGHEGLRRLRENRILTGAAACGNPGSPCRIPCPPQLSARTGIGPADEDTTMKHGARNDIPAEVVAIKRGSVMAQVEAKIVGTDYRITSVMTLDSLDELDLKHGDTVHVIAKAVNVLLVKP